MSTGEAALNIVLDVSTIDAIGERKKCDILCPPALRQILTDDYQLKIR